MLVAILVGFTLLIVAFLYFLQDRMIYYPQAYAAGLSLLMPKGARQIDYTSAAGRQTAVYLPPVEGTRPERLWLTFNGNASLALDWMEVLEKAPDPRAGFLLIEYPGYGGCEGAPTPESILESTEQALKALARELGEKPEWFEGRMSLLGYSLGAAAALQFAPRHDVRRIVLISPFTSMREMARRTVGWPLCQLLRHRYDNRARMTELARRPNRPEVTILHGEADNLIPIAMGRELAAMGSGWARFHPVPGADHIFIIMAAEQKILAALAPPAVSSTD